MDQIVYSLLFDDSNEDCLFKLYFSDNPAWSDNCDSVIGYGIFSPITRQCIDGGEMEYDSSVKNYTSIEQAADDVIAFAFDGAKPKVILMTDIDPYDLDDWHLVSANM